MAAGSNGSDFMFLAGGGDLVYRLPEGDGRGPGKDIFSRPEFRNDRGHWEDSGLPASELKGCGYDRCASEHEARDGHYF